MKHLWRLTPVNFYALWEEWESMGRTARQSPPARGKDPSQGGEAAAGVQPPSPACLSATHRQTWGGLRWVCVAVGFQSPVSRLVQTPWAVSPARVQISCTTHRQQPPPDLWRSFTETLSAFTLLCHADKSRHFAWVKLILMLSLETILRHIYPCGEEETFILLYTDFIPPSVPSRSTGLHTVALLVAARNL